MNKHLNEIAKIISKFLKANGGYDNGYDTYVNGGVTMNVFRNINTMTPEFKDLTIRQIQEKERLLYNKILKYITKHNIESINVSSSHVEHGCFRIYVSFTQTVRVNL